MNEMALFGDQRMTVKEVAEALNVSEQTIRYWVRKLYPEQVENGKATTLDEEQATAIKGWIGSGRNDLANVREVGSVTTELEMKQKAAEVIGWLISEADRLSAELAKATPKIESFDALMRSEKTMSITDAAKHFGLHPKTEVFPYLRERGYLTMADIPTQAAIDSGYLALREAHCQNGEVRKQAVVLASQLETWRTRVVPQIAAWKALI